MSNAEGHAINEDEDMSDPEGRGITTSLPNLSSSTVDLRSPVNPPSPNNPSYAVDLRSPGNPPSLNDPSSPAGPPFPRNSSSLLTPSLPPAVIERVQATLTSLAPQEAQSLEASLRTLVRQEVGSQCHQLAESLNAQISAIQRHILDPTEDQDTLMQQTPSSEQNQNGGNPDDGDDEDDDERGPGRRTARAGKVVLTVGVALPLPTLY